MPRNLVRLLSLILLLSAHPARLNAEGVNKGSKQSLSSVKGTPSSAKLNINQLSNWFYNNGISDIDKLGNPGFVYPKGSGRTAFFPVRPRLGRQGRRQHPRRRINLSKRPYSRRS